MVVRVDVDMDFDAPFEEWEYLTDEFLDDSEEILARTGARYVREFADSHIRDNRGHYVKRVRQEQRGARWVITDQRSDYGPWLAGTSRRNRKSKFKGYPHWREARELLDNDKVKIIEPVLRGYRRRLRS